MNNTVVTNKPQNTVEMKKAVLILLWVSITIGHVLYKMAQRPGEFVSTLIITFAVIGILSLLLPILTKLYNPFAHRSSAA